MSRLRERESGTNYDPIETTVTSYDMSYPFNGPWTSNVSVKTTSLPTIPDYSEVCLDDLHPGPPWKSGGPLTLHRVETDQRSQYVAGPVLGGYTGQIQRIEILRIFPAAWPTSYLSYTDPQLAQDANWGDPSSWGATAWNRFQPVRSQAGMGQFVAEIRDLPRTLMGTAQIFRQLYRTFLKRRFHPRQKWTKAVANEWVNTQFGWAPFIRDLRDFYEATTSMEKRVADLKRNNKQWVKRGGTVHTSDETEVITENENLSVIPPQSLKWYANSSKQGHLRVTRRTRERVWFSARFRYWIPTLESSPWDLRSKAIIYGAIPSPELVWELIPWSWLIDWCSNVGDVIANISNSLLYGLCAKYAYVMCTKEQEVSSSHYTTFVVGTYGSTWKARLTSKYRVQASPFGFGLSSGDFSAWQWSILSALGLSRLL